MITATYNIQPDVLTHMHTHAKYAHGYAMPCGGVVVVVVVWWCGGVLVCVCVCVCACACWGGGGWWVVVGGDDLDMTVPNRSFDAHFTDSQ